MNVALQAAGGRPYVSSIAYGNYRSRINDGVCAFTGDTGPDVAWSSASERLPQWAAVVFAHRCRISRVRIVWGRRGEWTTSARFEVQGWADGGWRVLGTVARNSPEPVTEVGVAGPPVEAVRVRQEPGGGPAGDPDRMCVAQLEAHGEPVDAAAVAYRPIRDAMEAEWEAAFAQMRRETTAEVLARMDAVEKREGGTGAIGAAERQRATRNRESSGWAKGAADRILEDAAWWLDKDDEFIHAMVPVENPRAISPSYERGCPIHGGGRRCMQTNSALPYRWQCVIGGEWWYNGARVENPATGEAVEVWDDGDGWIAPEGFANPGTIYHFQAGWRYYVLSKLFFHPYEPTIEAPDAYTGQNAITQLSLAYALTGDRRYAHRAGVLLNRLAEVYRFYDGTVDEQRPLTRGYLVQVSWEENPIYDCLAAYDLVMDAMLDDAPLLDFFRAKGDCDYNADGRVDEEDLRYNIQHNLFGHMYEWLHRAMAIQKGDYVVREGLVLWALGHVFGNEALIEEAVDGPYGLAVNLTNNTFRDGKWWYDSPGYAVGSVTQPVLQRLLAMKGTSRFDDPRLRIRQLIDFCVRIDCDGRLPGIGDTGGADSRRKVLHPHAMCRIQELARIHTGERRYAERLAAVAQGDPDGLRERYAGAGLLFHADPLMEGTGDAAPETAVFHDSGFAILRTGRAIETRKHVVLNYGKGNAGHGHRDKLALNLIAFGYDLAADLGYPTTFTHPKVDGWEKHTMSHATVCVDGESQSLATGSLEFAGRTPGTQAVCATGERAYPGVTDRYRRTVCLVDVSEDDAYVFDVFEVSGGRQHDYAFRSLSGEDGERFEITFDGEVRTEAQGRGTLAGPDVAFGDRPGVGFIRDITRTPTADGWRATWRIGNADDAGIRLHMAGERGREVFTGKGEGYGFFGQSPWDACVIARSRPADGAATTFAAALEPFRKSPFVRAVSRLPVTGGVGLRVDLDGRTDYLMLRQDASSACTASVGGCTVSLDGRLGRVSVHRDGAAELHLLCGRALSFGEARVTADDVPEGEVLSVDPAAGNGHVRVRASEAPEAGETLLFRNTAYPCNSSYEAAAVEPSGSGVWAVDLHMSLVLSEGRILHADGPSHSFVTDTCLTKLRMCRGLFDGKAVYVDGVRCGRIRSAGPDTGEGEVRAFVSGVQTDAVQGRELTVFRMDEGADLSAARLDSRFVVCDLDAGDRLTFARSAHARIS